MHAIGHRGMPVYIFASAGDQALEASARLHGQRLRVGMITDPAALADLPVTVIDVTAVKGSGAFGHNTVQTSPVMRALFNGLEDLGPETIADAVANRSVVAGERRRRRRGDRNCASTAGAALNRDLRRCGYALIPMGTAAGAKEAHARSKRRKCLTPNAAATGLKVS